MTNTQNEHVQKNLDAIMKLRYQGNTNGRQEKKKTTHDNKFSDLKG